MMMCQSFRRSTKRLRSFSYSRRTGRGILIFFTSSAPLDNESDNGHSQSPPSVDAKMKLLIHAEDGSFPFLTEYLLQTYFNPKDEMVKDHLILGIAVKDTCVVPVYKEKENRNLKRKRSSASGDGDANANVNDNANDTKSAPKPTGYTFDSESIEKQTRLLPGYHTLTLPSFDLLDDVRSTIEKAKVTKNKKGAKDAKCAPALPTVSSSRDKLSLPTPNGMQQISPEMYTEVAVKLQCESMLALYDQAHPEEGNKRKASAADRTKLWFDRCLATLESADKKVPLWASLSCFNSERSLTESIRYLTEKQDSLEGISVVGWHHIKDRDERNALLGKCVDAFKPGTKFAILAASNLEQVLDAAKNGVYTIGSALPVTWARSHKALALDFASSDSSSNILDENGCIDLSQEIYCRDASPLLPGCHCLACRDGRYTRSYVHHLIKAKELLAEILLFGHNLHQMLVLFKELSGAAGEKRIEHF